MAKRIRNKDSSFIGLQLTPELLTRLDEEVEKTTLNRSQLIRLAIIEYLNNRNA
jgi:metal-responsive CopG/Arc/MetJ family transcriptional regulator